VESIRQLLARHVPLGAQWQQVAHIAADQGEMSLSRQAMERFVEASGGHPMARYQQVGLLARGGALRQAYDVLCALPEDVPDPAVNAYSRGAAALPLGDVDEARRQLERVTVLRPELGQAWLPLSTLIDFADEPDLAERIVAAERAMEGAAPAARAVYYHALGKAYGDLREHSLAFAAFERGARLKRAGNAYDRERDRVEALEAVRGYDAEGIAAIAREQREPTARSIFVTGLPRSGTTLVEQILASHSAVSDGAEINRLRILARDTGGAAYPELARYVAAHGTAPAAQLWAHWLDDRFPELGRVVDKSMDTSRFLGLAAALLPEAPLIWLTRDPLDCAWSCFRTHFLAGVPWTCDLADIAFHFRIEEHLLARWRDILGERLLVVPYEALVADPATWIRHILGHCGLAEEPGVFAPHENRRAVTTSSVMQVRKPINRAAVGSAEPYRAFLAPFIEAYGD
jgi:tetratricopeptide (TPR) repeat protein